MGRNRCLNLVKSLRPHEVDSLQRTAGVKKVEVTIDHSRDDQSTVEVDRLDLGATGSSSCCGVHLFVAAPPRGTGRRALRTTVTTADSDQR